MTFEQEQEMAKRRERFFREVEPIIKQRADLHALFDQVFVSKTLDGWKVEFVLPPEVKRLDDELEKIQRQLFESLVLAPMEVS